MRTLDDIIPPSRRAPTEQPTSMQPDNNEPPRPAPRQYQRPRSRFPWGTAIVALIIVVIAIGALLYFSGAEVQVTPNSDDISAQGSYTALAAATSTDTLPFEVISEDKTDTQNVPASGTQNVTTNASGSITISNTSSATVKLITNTRFENTDGLVFRIHAAVSIPAKGTATATVYADQPGSQYNIGPSSFTVPGLANTAQFTEVTAQSNAAMTGGASGTEPVVDPTTLSTAQSSLQAGLAPELTSALEADVPAGYVLLPGATNTAYAPTATSVATGQSSMASVSEDGTITGVVFPNAALAAAIAETTLGASYDGEPYSIQNPSDLTLTPATTLPGTSDQTFTFSLTGTADLVATIDPSQIASAVAGKSRAEAQVALTNYPAIKSAVLILRPFWKTAFPEDPTSIKVVVETAQ